MASCSMFANNLRKKVIGKSKGSGARSWNPGFYGIDESAFPFDDGLLYAGFAGKYVIAVTQDWGCVGGHAR